jgi:hypothetical protein
MGQRGVLFTVDEEGQQRLRAAAGDDELLVETAQELEMTAADDDCPTDKAWDAIHRCLTDGRLGFNNGAYPLNAAVLGGRQLHQGDDYIVSYLTADQVRDVAAAVANVDEAWFRRQYWAIDPDDYGPEHGEVDLEYTVRFFADLVRFFARAAQATRATVFVVDQ